jgi:hypothetical protein
VLHTLRTQGPPKVGATTHRFFQGPAKLDHYVRQSGPTGGAPTGEFIDMLRRAAGSSRTIQKLWLGTTNDGALWTTAGGHNDYGDGSGFLVSFDLKPGRRGMYDPWNKSDEAAWKSWATRTNLKRPNFFRPHQVEELKGMRLPSHSAFYEQNGLFGVAWRYNKGVGNPEPQWPIDDYAHNALLLVDARAVSKLKVKRDFQPDRGQLDDFKTGYPAKDLQLFKKPQLDFTPR